MLSADLDWLKALRRDFTELRQEIRCLIHEFEERTQESQPAAEVSPASS